MKMMKNGADVQYVPDVFVDSFIEDGYEICGENKEAVESVQTPGIPPVTPPDNSDDNAQQNPDNSSADNEDDSSVTPPDNSDDNAQQNPDNSDEDHVHICPYCDKEYAREGDLKNHIEKKHPAE